MNVQVQIDGEWGIMKSEQGEVEFAIENDGISIFRLLFSKNVVALVQHWLRD